MNSQAVSKAFKLIAAAIGNFLWAIFGRMFWVWVVIIMAVFIGQKVSDVSRYSEKYGVPKQNVHVDRKPTACDWGHAPIGSKDCHFERVVTPIKDDAGRVTDVYVSWTRVND